MIAALVTFVVCTFIVSIAWWAVLTDTNYLAHRSKITELERDGLVRMRELSVERERLELEREKLAAAERHNVVHLLEYTRQESD